ncbi:MAG: tetratricopeptide repeat protein [Betaproteobacteria bacterium]|nr:tetratricopeptide repeat protein [Betaproteobacteria bacterium]
MTERFGLQRMVLGGLALGMCAWAAAADPAPALPATPSLPATQEGTAPAPLPEKPVPTPRDIQQLVSAGKLEEALTALNRYLEVNSQDGSMQFLKAQLLTRTGKTDDAIATLENLTERFPEMVAPYNNLAVLYASQNRLEDARKILEMAVAVQPNYPTAYENLADVYLALARRAYARALTLDPNNKTLKAKAAKFN